MRNAHAANVIDIVPLLASTRSHPNPVATDRAPRRPLIAAMAAVAASGAASVAGAGMLAGGLAALAFLIIFIVLFTTRA